MNLTDEQKATFKELFKYYRTLEKENKLHELETTGLLSGIAVALSKLGFNTDFLFKEDSE